MIIINSSLIPRNQHSKIKVKKTIILFKNYKIVFRSAGKFIDGGLIGNNPTLGMYIFQLSLY